MSSVNWPLTPTTTGIGSLPHHNIDAALAFSFRTDIPFLPQIPIRNPWEFMIAQALEGMPGLEMDRDGVAQLRVDVWAGRSKAFNERLLAAFASAADPDAFAAFEPSAAASSSWQPFLWELQERKAAFAKVQLAGPLTSQWALRLNDGTSTDKHPEIGAQVFRLVLARALGMCRRLQEGKIQPILFFDEPGLYGLSPANPRHVLGLQELKLTVQMIRKAGVIVGLHCCSNTNWRAVLSLGLDVVSIDTALSLPSLQSEEADLRTFLQNGGRLSLGVVPTARDVEKTHAVSAVELLDELKSVLGKRLDLLRSSLLTPACGLALHSPAEAEHILATLLEFRRLCKETIELWD